jgi:hypothetical protein
MRALAGIDPTGLVEARTGDRVDQLALQFQVLHL